MESIIKSVSFWSKYILNHPDKDTGVLAVQKEYEIMVGNTKYFGEVCLVQTRLIDLVYDLCILEGCRNSKVEIDLNQSLYLIDLYNVYLEKEEEKKLKYADSYLYIFGFFGEQRIIQNLSLIQAEFSREKYILEEISYKTPKDLRYGIDVKQEFESITGFNGDDYSALLFLIWAFFASETTSISPKNIKIDLKNPLFSENNIKSILENYSITVDEISSSILKRQVLYTKPIIKFGDHYICPNSFLLVSVFKTSIFWALRNKYCSLKSQNFINAFGHFFETYVAEILFNCLNPEDYYKIEVDNKQKRSDWFMKLGRFEFLIEQKSSLSSLSVKQNQPNVKEMENHIINKWGEAVRQLKSTQDALGINNPIKIILVYEYYYKSECLDILFKLDKSLENDKKYWLLSIGEFEDLLLLYSKNPTEALKIIEEKDQAEIESTNNGRELELFFSHHKIGGNLYLKEYGILDSQYGKIRKMIKE